MNRADERKLIERAVAGDRDAAGLLIRTHQQSVYSYLLRMSGRPDVAEDIVQEAFVRVLTNLHRFDHRYRFSTWLFTIARRLYMNACAKLRPAYDTDMVSSWKGDHARPEASMFEGERREVYTDTLQQALDTLNTDQREIIILFHQLDWPIALIAQHLDMPEGTVKSHLHRGRNRMRQVIEQRSGLSERLAEVRA